MGSVFGTLMGPQTSQARERRLFGLVTAKVTGIMADGTYEVSYLSMGDDEPSAPARVMMPNAGAKRGMYFFPDTGDEVVIAFQNGDVNSPVILGAAYNSDSQPPDQAKPSPDNNVRTIVSRSGHEITLDDSPGAGKVTVKSKSGHQVVMDESGAGKVTVASAGGATIEIDDGAGSVKISAPVQIELSAPVLKLSATTMTVSAPGGFQVNTTGSVTASTFVVDGKPFGLHVHAPPVIPPAGTTGPVGP